MAKPIVLQDIENLENNLLVGRYYIPTIIPVSKSPITLTTNPIPTTWTGSGSYYANGQYTIETFLSPSGVNALSNAFNGSVSDGFHAIATTNSEASIIISLPEALRVTAFRTYIPDKSGIDQLSIQGSNNRDSWSTIYTYDSLDDSLTDRVLSSPNSYRFYKFLFTLDSTTTIEVREIQIASYEVSTLSNQFTVNEIPDSISENQRIFINTPEFSTVGVTDNILNAKYIDTLLLPNRYYELVYKSDIDRFTAKEVL